MAAGIVGPNGLRFCCSKSARGSVSPQPSRVWVQVILKAAFPRNEPHATVQPQMELWYPGEQYFVQVGRSRLRRQADVVHAPISSF